MAESKKDTRSSITTVKLPLKEYKAIDTYETKSKLPFGQYLLEHGIHLCQPVSKGEKQISKNDASKTVAFEIRNDWMSKNVYPLTECAVAKKIRDDYETLMVLVRYERTSHKKDDKWTEKAKNFNDTMCAHAYDIRTKNIDSQSSLEAETGVKMTDEDENFYLDNCYGDCVAICTPTVPKAWTRKKKREETRNLSAERKRMKIDELRDAESLSYEPDVEDTIDHDQDDHDVHDEPFIPTKVKPTTPTSSRQIRSNPVTPSSASHDDKAELKYFSDVEIRTGRRTLNEALVRCIVQCVSEFKVSHADISGIIVRSANMIFGQNWQISSDENVDEDDEANQSDDDSGDENTATCNTTLTRKRKSVGDLTYIFPSKRYISMYPQDAYLLNLKHVASYLTNKGDNIITVGLDDTTKAAGHKMYDIKTDHITVHGPEGKKSLTTGLWKTYRILEKIVLQHMKRNVKSWQFWVTLHLMK